MKTKDRIKLRSGMSREEIERYLDEQDEVELEEMRMKKQNTPKRYSQEWRDKREEYLESQGLSSYDIWKDEQAELEFEENWNEDLD